jgi:hypothetical protein
MKLTKRARIEALRHGALSVERLDLCHEHVKEAKTCKVWQRRIRDTRRAARNLRRMLAQEQSRRA